MREFRNPSAKAAHMRHSSAAERCALSGTSKRRKNEPDRRSACATLLIRKVQKSFKSVLYRNSYHYPGCSIRVFPAVVHRTSGLVDYVEYSYGAASGAANKYDAIEERMPVSPPCH